MATNLADSYKKARLTPTADIIERRQASLEKLQATLSDKEYAELIRIFFSIPSQNSRDWFVEPLRENDASFSLEDNGVETKVLAAYLLESGIESESLFAATALVSAYLGGARTIEIKKDLVDIAKHAIKKQGVEERKHLDINVAQIASPPKSKLGAHDKLKEALEADPSSVADKLSLISGESSTAITALASATRNIIERLSRDNSFLREQAEILWWHIGNWSDTLARPFAEFSLATSAILMGIELAEITTTVAGPISAPAVLSRTILAHPNGGQETKVTIQESIDGIAKDDFASFPLMEDVITLYPDLCPILNALLKAKTICGADAWHASFEQTSHIPCKTSFRPLELALQVYREQLMCHAYTGGNNE